MQKDYKNSAATQIVDLVYEATNNKGKTENFITKFSKIYTPIVIILAIIIAVCMPLILKQEFKTWILRSLVFLVATCPCSIVISVPLAFFSCIGKVSKKWMIIKGSKHIENLSKAKYVAFDKTGTITTGKMQIDELNLVGDIQEEALEYMYVLEKNSNHPISTAIKQKVESEGLKSETIVNEYEEIAGYGVKGKIKGKEVLFGNSKLLEKSNIKEQINKNASYLIVDGKVEANVTFKEEIRESSFGISEKLNKVGIAETIILTGDNEESAKKIANRVGINKIFAGLLPKQKLEEVSKLKENGKVIFIGDGINDSPVLAESDFGIAMGDASEIAESSADALLISNNIGNLPNIIKIAKKSMRIIKFNIAFSLIVKAIVLTLGVIRYSTNMVSNSSRYRSKFINSSK